MRNRRVAAQAAVGGRILYAGEAEKRRLVTELSARSGVEPDVVCAAVADFDGCTLHSGSNRNAVLLDASGGAVLMVDDDTTARAVRPVDGGDGLRVSSRYDPWSLRFFATVEDALEAAKWQDEDLLAWHRAFLGRSPAGCAFAPTTPNVAPGIQEDHSALDLGRSRPGIGERILPRPRPRGRDQRRGGRRLRHGRAAFLPLAAGSGARAAVGELRGRTVRRGQCITAPTSRRSPTPSS